MGDVVDLPNKAPIYRRTTGPQLVAEGCEMLADWLEPRAAHLPRADAEVVRDTIEHLRRLAQAA